MLHETDTKFYRWLRVTIGAMIAILLFFVLIVIAARWVTFWSPPGVVPIPDAPDVEIGLHAHPRLVVSLDAINSLRDNPDSPEYLRIMRKAHEFYDEYLVDPLQGDTIYPGYFALAWKISGEERYLDAARDMVLNQCHFPLWRRRPESSNFYKIELAYAVGLAYDLLYDEFSAEERERIEENLSDVLDGLLWHLEGNPNPPFWHEAPHSNYYVAWHSAAGLLTVCLGDSYHHWEDALAYSYEGLQPSIELLESDGGWIEGLTYLDFCWGQHALMFLNALRVNDGPNRLEDDWYKTSVLFALNGILPSGQEQVNFGDNISDPIASFGYLWRAKAFADSPFLDEFLDDRLGDPDYPRVPLDAILVQAMLQYDPTLPLFEIDEPSPVEYFPGIEWTMLRRSWDDPEGFYLAAKAGYGGWDHNHVDQGSFILAFDRKIFIVDPGRGVFSDRQDPVLNNLIAGPLGHNVFCPGTGEDACFWDDFTMYSENSGYRQSDAEISGWVDTPEYTSFSMNLDGAYPSENLHHWQRLFVWRKPIAELPGGAVIILDDADVPGHVRLVTPARLSERREGVTLVDGERRLGVWAFSPGHELTYRIENNIYSVLAIQDSEAEGVTTILTVLLPWDEIAEVVCEPYEDEDTIGAFVDGFLFEFARNEKGGWEFIH